ncbi:MAG: ParB/RepB/Spo0J family partition protein [Tissierellia bacterium]|nr:ParB/RepB/Spo0J family partition protein [Tissierellia bacterium]
MATPKRGLGKGLSALIGDKPMVEDLLGDNLDSKENIIKNIPLSDIIPRDDQPRKQFSSDSLKELSKSIELHGVIQPIIVRKIDDKYEIVAGERRYRASLLAGLKEIACIVKDMDVENASKLALIENIQREDLNPIEEALAYRHLVQEYNLKQEDIGMSLGKSRTYITNTMRLLNLEEKIIKYISDGKLTSGHGKVLLGVKEPSEQIKLADKIIDFNLNVRDTETEVKKKKATKKTKTAPLNKDPYILDLEDNLMRALGTKVNLNIGDKKGKIEIEYYGEEDLERIYDILIG